MSTTFFERHRATLELALQAITERGYWSPYSENPSPRVYGETAAADGKTAFDARLNRPFEIDQAGTIGRVGHEISPYGPALGIDYPKADIDQLLQGVNAARVAWRKAGPEVWAGV
eukprot:gene37727-45361_t